MKPYARSLLPFLAAACAALYGAEHCGNGVDDDGDTLVDCADPDCGTDYDRERVWPTCRQSHCCP